MRNRIFKGPLLALAVIGLATVVLLNRRNLVTPAMAQPQETRRVEKWEYCYMSSPFNYNNNKTWKVYVSQGGETQMADSDRTGVAALNKLGGDGWELVSASDEVVSTGLPTSTRFVLKRPR